VFIAAEEEDAILYQSSTGVGEYRINVHVRWLAGCQEVGQDGRSSEFAETGTPLAVQLIRARAGNRVE